ncbi:alpha/beta hydrolase [Prescottella agglutinans]|uniref:Dienelactone hydrolase n=1 Tax=Prescottella agglutinans TaxID=1644129 RepID=A0ABT6M9I8_9NOCA|nr:alpha/beta hydrolase [Prescottella agglutinans]MDH6280978.1 dienelactone hydrolase [Prescottella agglutinans]
MTLRRPLVPTTRRARTLLLAAMIAVPMTSGFSAPALASVPAAGPTAPAAPAAPEQQSVSERYAATGVHDVTSVAVPGYQVFYPTDIDTSPDLHPVVTFGNGSYATYEQYEQLLRHLASWGFVVVVADSSVTGDGTEILAAARYILAQNDNPESVFHDRIDVAHVAAVGHSQGAGGSINASTHSDGLITSTAVLDLPDPWWASRPVDVIDVARLTAPVFYLTGSDDPVSTAIPQAAYHAVSPVPAARGRLLGVGHNWPSDGGGFRGYLTAWLRFTLTDDTDAARAFVGPAPELLADPRWDGTAVKGW